MNSISSRMFAVFAALFAAMAMMAAVALYSNNGLAAALTSVYADRVQPLRDLKAISDAYAVDIVETTHKTRAGVVTQAEALAAIERARQVSGQKWRDYMAHFVDEREKALTTAASERFSAAVAAIGELDRS